MSAVIDEPVKPGMVKMVKLANEGRLARGDTVETANLGLCTVEWFRDANTVVVRDRFGGRFSLSIEWGGKATLEGAPA